MPPRKRRSVPSYEQVSREVRANRRAQYDARDDSWSGRNAPDRESWEAVKQRADENIAEGTVYYESLIDKETKRVPSGVNLDADQNRYADLIVALESGRVSPDDLLNILDDQFLAMQDYARGYGERGRDRWFNRDHNLPDSLFWYHIAEG